MLLPGENSPKSWLFVTILVSTIFAYSEASAGKTLDIKVGFDITQGAIGAPLLRIRDFEDSREYNPRALAESNNDDSGSDKKKASSEEVAQSQKEEASKESVKADKSDDDDEDDDGADSGDDDTVRITRGPKNGDFEPEEDNPKIHDKVGKDFESENNSDGGSDRRRYKRQIDRFGDVAKRR